MKKILIFAIACFIVSSAVFAADFSPTLLKFSAPETIQYDFDGSDLEIPVTATGTPSLAIFTVFTKEKATDIIAVNNGFLGWHYVNKIDTCLYIAPMQQFDVGSNKITWDGKDSDGGLVPAGDYTYYIYAYDNVSQKTLVTRFVSMNRKNRLTEVSFNENGIPKAQPEFYSMGLEKIVIGNDPEDSTLVETTAIAEWGSRVILVPDNHSYFFRYAGDVDAIIGRVGKYQWVPNGDAVIQTDWAEEGYSTFSLSGAARATYADMADVGGNLIVATHDYHTESANNQLTYITINDGSVEQQIDISDRWWSTEDSEAGGQGSGGPSQVTKLSENRLILSRFNACYREMIDPFAEEEDMVIWGNDNGDYVGDHNSEPDSGKPWVCNDYNVAPYKYVTDADANLFSSFGSYDLGAVSFGLFAPDGTGIGYFSFAGETAEIKQGTEYIDYDSPYDGIYTDNNSTGAEEETGGLWFIAHDSIAGIITSSPVAVEESTPTTFVVAQNSPNPFNPTTTISFSTAEAGNVAIDVFNVAGQKVDTITSEFMNTGNHSVTWDASEFSAGVYFYMVKSGDFSKTMKMTLLK